MGWMFVVFGVVIVVLYGFVWMGLVFEIGEGWLWGVLLFFLLILFLVFWFIKLFKL